MPYRLLIRIPAVTVVILKMLFVVCVLASAQETRSYLPSPDPARVIHTAQRMEAARLRLKLYQNQEYPLQRRRLDAEIAVAKAQVDSLKRQQAEYGQFSRFKYSAPLFATRESVAVRLVQAEQHLRTLSEEKSLLERFHQDRVRLLLLEVELAQSAGLIPAQVVPAPRHLP